MPVDAPRITRAETVVTGGDLRLVDGLISDAGRLVGAAVEASDEEWFEVATLKEPYRIEGKKTMGLEIAEQLGWRMPDVILYPTGGGVGLIGIHKALIEARDLGWVEGDLPRLVAVQATGCAPIVTAFENGAEESVKVEDSSTVAFGINVPKALGDFLILRAVRQTHGTAVAVDDADLLADLALTARLEGMFLCPEGAATVTRGPAPRAHGLALARRRGGAAEHRGRRDLPRHRHGRRPDDRQGRRAGAVTGRLDRCAIVLVARPRRPTTVCSQPSVEVRATSSGSRTTCWCRCSGLSASSSTSSAARRPSSWRGWRTEVSGTAAAPAK